MIAVVRTTRIRPCLRPRPGAAVLVVLALVSVALAMSYAVLRSQTVGMQLQANNSRGSHARHAALAGLSVGMRKMRLDSWAGTGSTINASISNTDSYSVTFVPGDTALVPADPDYELIPYRVTIVSTGTSVDPSQPTVFSTHQAQAVMQLVPRQLGPEPSNWSTMLDFTLYQREADKVELALPVHIEGPVRLQGEVDVHSAYSWSSSPRSRYFSDLNAMRNGGNEVQRISADDDEGYFTVTFDGETTGNISADASSWTVRNALENLSTIGDDNVAVSKSGDSWTVTFKGDLAATDVSTLVVDDTSAEGDVTVTTITQGAPGTPDYRPFTGPLYIPTINSSVESLTLLAINSGITVIVIPETSTPAPALSSNLTYRLYPGGPQYNVATLPSDVSNTTLAADPATNPLGLYYNAGNVDVHDNVSIVGTIIVGNTLDIHGTNVSIVPHAMRPLDGSSAALQLPSVVTLNELHVHNGAAATINGTLVVGKKLLVKKGTESTSLVVTGNMIVGENISVESRDEWESIGNSLWQSTYSSFQGQLQQPNATAHFPVWVASQLGRNYVPAITIRPDAAAPDVHWPDTANPIYQVKSGDSGLHWDLVRWTNRL